MGVWNWKPAKATEVVPVPQYQPPAPRRQSWFDQNQAIEQGVAEVLDRQLNPLTPRTIHGHLPSGIPVAEDERDLEDVLIKMVGLCVSQRRWSGHKFMYPCDLVGIIHTTEPWRALSRGAMQHKMVPYCHYEPQFFMHNMRSWACCVVRFELM